MRLLFINHMMMCGRMRLSAIRQALITGIFCMHTTRQMQI